VLRGYAHRSKLNPLITPPAPAPAATAAPAAAGREKTRLTAESGARQAGGVVGTPFTLHENPAFLAERTAVYDEDTASTRLFCWPLAIEVCVIVARLNRRGGKRLEGWAPACSRAPTASASIHTQRQTGQESALLSFANCACQVVIHWA